MKSFQGEHSPPVYALCGLVLVVALVYANSLENDFHFDDEHSLVGNPHIRKLVSIPAFFLDPQMFSRNPGSGMYRPLVLVSYALNYAIGGYGKIGYHLVNLGIHLGVVLLVYFLFGRMGVRAEWALAGGVLFGIHPLTTEPVNYISSRSESMAALFYLGSLLLYMRKTGRDRICSLVCFVCGLLSKATVITLPFMLLVYDIGRGRKMERGQLFGYLPYWAVAGVYLIAVRMQVEEALIEAPVRSAGEQLATQIKGLVYYLKLFTFPHPLNVEHQFFPGAEAGMGVVVISLILLASLLFAVFFYGIRGRRILFWIGLIVVPLLPTLIVPLNMLVNERRIYLSSIGWIGLVVWSLQEEAEPRVRQIGILVLCALGLMTFQRNRVWKSEWTLWRDAVEKAPAMVRPHLRVGAIQRQTGHLEEAETSYRKGLELDPESGPGWNNLGNLYVEEGAFESAEKAFLRALEIAPLYPEANLNLATLYGRQGRYDEALELYERLLPLSGNREDLLNNLGTLYLRMERYGQAEQVLRRAAELDPASARIRFNLGGALEGQEKYDEAVESYGAAIALAPGTPGPYYNLGSLLERLGRKVEAKTAYTEFLRLWRGDPRFAAAAAEAERRMRIMSGEDR